MNQSAVQNVLVCNTINRYSHVSCNCVQFKLSFYSKVVHTVLVQHVIHIELYMVDVDTWRHPLWVVTHTH